MTDREEERPGDTHEIYYGDASEKLEDDLQQDDSDSDICTEYDAKGNPTQNTDEADEGQRAGTSGEDGAQTFVLFDFRRGKSRWPERAELVGPERAAKLIAKARRAVAAEIARKVAKAANSGGSSSSFLHGNSRRRLGFFGGRDASSRGIAGEDEDLEEKGTSEDGASEDPFFQPPPKEAQFEVLPACARPPPLSIHQCSTNNQPAELATSTVYH